MTADDGAAVVPMRSTIEGADYRLELPNIIGWINANDNTGGKLWHKRAKLVDAWRRGTRWHAQHARLPRLDRAYIIAELCFNDVRRRDPANYYPTVKASVDGLVDAGVLADDSARYLIGPDMRLGPRARSARHKGLLVLHLFRLPTTAQTTHHGGNL